MKVSARELLALRVDRGRIGCLVENSLGERSLLLIDAGTMQVIARRTVAAEALLFNGEDSVLMDSLGQLTVLDPLLTSARSLPGDPRYLPLALRGKTLWLLERNSATGRVVRIRLDATAEEPERSPPLPPDAGFAAASLDLVVFASAHGTTFSTWTPGRAWRDFAAEGRNPIGVEGALLLALGEGGEVFSAVIPAVNGGFEWTPRYRGARGAALLLSDHATVSGAFPVVEVDTGCRATLGRAGATIEPRRIPLPCGVQSDRASWDMDGEYLTWSSRKQGILELCVVKLDAAAARPPPAEATPGPLRATVPEVTGTPLARALAWLKSQLSPTFTTRSGATGRLIDSYEDSTRSGWTYDAALASIALAAAGERDPAAQLLAGLEDLQLEDGSFPFAFDPIRARPLGDRRYSGTVAWVVMAANYYEWTTGDARYASMAVRALGYLERLIHAGAEPGLRGAVSMGPVAPRSFSTEHQADAFSAFLWRGILGREERYQVIAEELRRFLLTEIWMPDEGRFRVGYRDAQLFLDAQTWTTLALGREDPECERLRRAVAHAETRLRVEDGKLGARDSVLGFNDAAGAAVARKVWSEGSEGMVAALHLLGEHDRARLYHLQTGTYQCDSGGIPYATANSAGWTSACSVAGTGWFILNELDPPRNPFRPGDSGPAARTGQRPRRR